MDDHPKYLCWPDTGLIVRVGRTISEKGPQAIMELLPIYVPKGHNDNYYEQRKRVGKVFIWGSEDPKHSGTPPRYPWDSRYVVISEEEAMASAQNTCPRCEADVAMFRDYLCERCRFGQ